MDETIYKRSSKGREMKKGGTKAYKLRFKNRTVDMTKTITIGRGAHNAIVLDKDPLVSRKHAVMEQKGESFTVRDLGSTNGTYVNGDPLQEGEVRILEAGDVIKLGKTEFTLLGV